MKPNKFRAWDNKNNCYFKPTYEAYKGNVEDLNIGMSGDLFMRTLTKSTHCNSVMPNRFIVERFTGYQMFEEDIYFGDLVSNNFRTSKEVIREIVEHEGCIMMKRVKGNSKLPKYISLHEWYKLNFKVIKNIHKNSELLK